MELKKILKEDSLFLIGMNFYGDPFEKASSWDEDNEIGELWKRFERFMDNTPNVINCIKNKNTFYEVHISTDDSCSKGYFEVFAGIAVDKVDSIPLNCVAKQLPSTKYAVFTLKGQEIVSDWNRQIIQEWLPSSGFELSYHYSIQAYDDRFKGMDNIDQSEMDVYIPVK